MVRSCSSSSSNHFYQLPARSFASSAAPAPAATAKEPKKSKPKRRRTLETKNPIIVTERAAERIQELLQGDNAKGAIGIILGVKRRKCLYLKDGVVNISFCCYFSLSIWYSQ
jgi:hypothetical protein